MTQLTLEWLHARTREEDGHLIWTRAHRRGMPTAWIEGQARPVRREVWTLSHEGRSPGSRLVVAKCGVHCCVSPDCLVLRTQSQLQQGPRTIAHRIRISMGMRANSAYSEELVRQIRASEGTLQEASEKFNVSPTYVSDVRLNKIRRDFSNPFVSPVR